MTVDPTVRAQRRDVGMLDKTYTHFLADETNTSFNVRLVMKAIHWHANPSNKVEYVATGRQRLEIPWVRYTGPDGTATEY